MGQGATSAARTRRDSRASRTGRRRRNRARPAVDQAHHGGGPLASGGQAGPCRQAGRASQRAKHAARRRKPMITTARFSRRCRSAFTLIEMLLVIVLMSILTGAFAMALLAITRMESGHRAALDRLTFYNILADRFRED